MAIPSCSNVSLSNDAKPDGNSYAYCLAAEIRALKTKNLQPRQISEGGTGSNNAASAIENLTGAASATVGQVLTKDASGVIWSTPASGGSGGGDVTGPASSINGNIPIFDGLTGKVLMDSGYHLPPGGIADVDTPQTLTNKVIGSGCTYSGTRIPVANGGVPDPAPATEGQVLTRVSGTPAWSTPSGAGIGNVTGPASSTDNVLAVFNGTTGKLLKNSTIPADDIARINATQTLTYKTLGGACVWAGAAIDEVYGGTGNTTYMPGDILYSTSINNLGKLPIGGAGQVLTVISGAPAWASAAGAGLGDVSGPVSAVANNFATFDGTTGKIIKDSGKAAPAGAFVGTTDVQSLSNKTMGSGCVWNGTDVAIADGGTGASTAQAAINNLTAVSAATAGHVLTKVGSDAVWAVAGAGAGSTNNLLSVLDYGAIGNGVADDTTAIQNCINACFSTGKNMLVPAGTYLVTSLTMNSDIYANHFSIFGEGRNKTIIRKYSTSSAPLLTIGDGTPAIFQANITMEGITFDGLNTITAAAVRTYDMVRSSFKDCTFMRANAGFELNGGVANQFYNCMFDACNYGVFMQWVSGMTSQPNETLFNGCQFVNNPLWGLYFIHGALCVLDSCEVEGNGTTGNASTGGVYAGSLETLAPSLINSQGIIAQGCWFEANAGRASCSFADGRNTVRDSYFIANPNSTHEIYVSGGTYVVDSCSFQNAKTHLLYETVGVGTGNYINAVTGSVPFTKSIDSAKTKVDFAGTSSSSDTWGDTTWVNTFHNTNRTVTSDVVADAQIISVAEVGKHGIVAASKSSGNASTGAQSTIGVASFVNNDNTANPQSAYGAYIETVRKSGASTTHGIEVGLTNYGTTIDSSPYNTSPTGLTEVARLAVNTGINAGTKVSHALAIVSVNESTSYANKFSKGIVFHNMALDGTNGNDGNKATAVALARGHSLDWFVYTGSGSGDLGPRLTSNVSVAADAMQQVFENKEVSFNNNVGTQSVAIKNNGIINLKNNAGTVNWTENGDIFVTNNKMYAVLGSTAKEVHTTPILRGYGTTAGGTGLLTVTFSTPFASTPNVQIQVVNNDTSQLIMSEVYNVTATGFTVRTKAMTSGSATVYGLAAGVYWSAAEWY